MHGLVWFCVVGAVVGWLAGQLVEGEGKGFFVNMIVGILGAIIGGYLSNALNIQVAGFWGNIGMAVMGSMVLLVLIRLTRSSK